MESGTGVYCGSVFIVEVYILQMWLAFLCYMYVHKHVFTHPHTLTHTHTHTGVLSAEAPKGGVGTQRCTVAAADTFHHLQSAAHRALSDG
jgi:hypothetical protein